MRRTVMKALVVSVGIVGVLTVADRRSSSHFFAYLLLPGLVPDLLITGGHGGAIFEEWVGMFVSVLVNTLVYTLALTALFTIWRRLREPVARL